MYNLLDALVNIAQIHPTIDYVAMILCFQRWMKMMEVTVGRTAMKCNYICNSVALIFDKMRKIANQNLHKYYWHNYDH